MKRFSMFATMLALCFVMVACGNNKKEEKKSVKEQFEYYEDALMKAAIEEDDAKGEKLMAEFILWYGGLNEADTAKADELLEESWLSEAFAEDEEIESVEEQFEYFESAIMEAAIAEDDAQGEQLLIEFIAWYGGLDEYDTAEVDALLEESWLGECLEAAFAE